MGDVRILRILPPIVAILIVGTGCAAEHAAAPAAPTRREPSAGRHTLGCIDELSAGTPEQAKHADTLGVFSPGWEGAAFSRGRPVRVGRPRYRFVKTYTYVTTAAASATTLRLVSPQRALLVYIDGERWTDGTRLQDKGIAAAAARSYTLTNCHSDRTGYAGGILLRRPACVHLAIVAHRPSRRERRDVKVPIGTPCD